MSNQTSDLILLNSKLDKTIKKYQAEPGALIPILQKTQEVYGYLPLEILEYISKGLRISLTQIYAVATFYAQFSLVPQAKNMIMVCHGTACHVSGAELISSTFTDKLGIEEKESTSDKKFSLDRVACLGCCSLAPVVMVNQDTYGRLTPEKVKEVIAKYD